VSQQCVCGHVVVFIVFSVCHHHSFIVSCSINKDAISNVVGSLLS
jgi:hypothetical protein